MKTSFKIFVALISLAPFVSCKKWLDVPPADKFTEDQVYKTPSGVAQAINGVYLDLSKNKLYGNRMSMSVMDVFAQRYNVSGNTHPYYKYGQYAFGEKPVIDVLDNLWVSMYVNITNLNNFLNGLDLYKTVPLKDDSLYRGEALGLRAMLHFDLLRMYGPMYNNADSLKTAIPYYKNIATSAGELLPANQVIEQILKDLTQASAYLSGDPVITKGVISTAEGDGQDFKRLRNYRLNYYAVKALEARVHLYRGNKQAAFASAKNVIDGADEKFPWINPANVISEKNNPDRIFSTEILFATQSLDMYTNYRNLFSPDLSDADILAPLDGRLKTLYENNEGDYRYTFSWPISGSKSYRTFMKFAPPASNTASTRYMLPLIRKSEVFYIAAESAPDATTGLAYLNTVRYNRGLVNVAPTANLQTELQKEYQKEFFGEGQLFFYYKRRGVTSIPNGNASSGNISMNASKYVFPLPLSETQYR